MKFKFLFVLIGMLSAQHIYAQKKSYTIIANIKGAKDNTHFYLRKNNSDGSGTDTVASGIITNGKLNIKGTVVEPELHFLFIENQKEYIPILLENNFYRINGSYGAWPILNVDGPESNREYLEIRNKYNNEVRQIKKVLNPIVEEIGKTVDSAKLVELYIRQNKVRDSFSNEILIPIIKQHRGSLYTPYVINSYLQVDWQVKKSLFEELSPLSQKGKYGRDLQKSIAQQKKRGAIKRGSIIPDFQLVQPNGDTVSIRQLAGQAEYTLIDFWASWCKPCRTQVPHLKEMYAQFKDRGFNIVAVSSDKKDSDWRKAMKEDNTPWIHGLQIKQNANELFGINAIPGYIMIDRQGKLIAYAVFSVIPGFGPDIRGETLANTLDSLLVKSPNPTTADEAWQELMDIGKIDPKELQGKTRGENLSLMEIRNRKFREEGLRFWNNFPNDRRKYIWFSTTTSLYLPVNYWSEPEGAGPAFSEFKQYSAKLDVKALTEWETLYPKLLAEYLVNSKKEKNELGQIVAHGVKIRTNASILEKQLSNYFYLLRNSEYRKYKKTNIDQIYNAFNEAASVAVTDKDSDPDHGYSPWGSIKKETDLHIMSEYRQLGLDINHVKTFMKKCVTDTNYSIQEYGMQKMSLLSLMEKPFTLKHAAMDGSEIDLEKMKGKVILVDFWSTSCKSCIAMMPRLREVYEKYQTDGFEVVSVCTNSESDRPQIEKIKAKIGASWPTLMIGGKTDADRNRGLFKEIWDRYGFRGVPQLLLLDREGKLIMYQGELHGKGLAKVIEKAVAKK